jgi:hypothetical protein
MTEEGMAAEGLYSGTHQVSTPPLRLCYKFSYLIALCHCLAIRSLYYVSLTRSMTCLLTYCSRHASVVYSYIIFSASLLIHTHSQTD